MIGEFVGHPSEKEKHALRDAVTEARRFIAAADALFKVIDEPQTRKRSAARRASLDLSESLAKFRMARK